jgi:rod shape-determining protein MreC
MTLREQRTHRRRALIFTGIVGACLVLLAIGRSEPAQELRRGIHFAVTPIQDALAGGTRSVTQVLGAFAEIEQLRQENRALSQQVEELTQQVEEVPALREENARLAKALDTKRALAREHETMIADVIGREATQFERVITLDRGTDAGLQVGDAVLSDAGALVGSIVEVGPTYSFVRLINDSRSVISGRDRTTRTTGMVGGRLSQPLEMTEVRVTDKIEIGHTVVTAGINEGRRFQSLYPPGLPIGKIIDVQQDPGSVVQTAFIQPSADLDRLESVLVITSFESGRRLPEPTLEAES